MATYKPNRVQFGRLMKSDGVSRFVRHEAEKLAEHLRSTAPRVTGEYASNFKVSSGVDIRKRDRAAAFVINDSPYATVLEVGSARIKNPPAPLTNALRAFRT